MEELVFSMPPWSRRLASLGLLFWVHVQANSAESAGNAEKAWAYNEVVGRPTTIPISDSARFVRIELQKEGWLNLAEVEIWGKRESSGNPENLALRKPAIQSSTANNGESVASLAVDGNTSEKYSDSSISHTNQERNPWWEVDLGEICKIQEIKIFNRADGVEDRLKEIKITISNETKQKSDWLKKSKSQYVKVESLPPPPLLLSFIPLKLLVWGGLALAMTLIIQGLWKKVILRKIFISNCTLFILILVLAMALKMNRRFESIPSIASSGASIALSKYNYGLDGYKAFLDYGAGPLYYGWLNSSGDFSRAVRKCITLKDPRLSLPPDDPEGPKVMALYYRDNYSFMASYQLGIVDYYALAFLIFGYSWGATFCLYFLILGFSALLFFRAFQDHFSCLTLLFSVLVSYGCLVVYLHQNSFALQDTRTVSCLGVIPTIHLMVFILTSSRWNRFLCLSVFAQILLLILIVRMRHSAIWFCLILPLPLAFSNARLGSYGFKLSKLCLALFPLLFMVGLKYGERFYLDREYISGTTSTSYTWHGIFLSLSPSKYFSEKYGADGSDASGFLSVEKYYRENDPEKLKETFWIDKDGRQINRLNWRLYEEGCGEIVQKIILDNKYEFLKLTFLDKTRLYFRHLINNTLPFVIPMILVIAAVFIFVGIPFLKCHKTNIFLIPFLLFCGSWFTPLIGKTLWHAVTDGLLSFWILFATGLMIAITSLSKALEARAQKNK
jgi:hypothetical protein